MLRLLPALHEGHAPIYLHQAFEDALDAFSAWSRDEAEPSVLFDGVDIPISRVFGRMRQCTDQLPERLFFEAKAAVERENGSLPDGPIAFAEASGVLRALCVTRLRDATRSSRLPLTPVTMQ